MKRLLRTTFGATAAATVFTGCDAPPPVDPVVPSAADSMQAVMSGSDLSYEALIELIREPDDFAAARKLGALLPTLGPEALPLVKEVLEDAAVLEMGAAEFEMLMRYWASHEPADAAVYALGKAPRGYQAAAIHGAVTPWARADPQQALESIRSFALRLDPLAGQSARNALVLAQSALVRGWYDSERPGLEVYIGDLGAGFEREQALAAYATALIRKHGVEALVRWAEAVPEDDATYKLEVYRNAATVLVPFDLQAAQRFCDAHCEGGHGSNLRSRIASRWAQDDAAAALDWLASAPEGQETNLQIPYSLWGLEDREAAVRWMKAKTDGEPPAWLPPLFPIYARLLAVESPAEGLAWATRVEDEKERESLTVEIARGWRQKDEAMAEAWLRQSSLSEEVLEKVRSQEP